MGRAQSGQLPITLHICTRQCMCVYTKYFMLLTGIFRRKCAKKHCRAGGLCFFAHCAGAKVHMGTKGKKKTKKTKKDSSRDIPRAAPIFAKGVR